MAVDSTSKPPLRPEYFATTHWSVVRSAGSAETSRVRQALAQLCQAYWYPLYAYVRRKGHSSHDAEDLTQEFFARLLEQNAFASARQELGKFRSFLLAAMNHFLADEWDRARAQKRGGGKVVSLDAHAAESRLAHEPVESQTPERLFERAWAMTLLETVYGKLRAAYESSGRGELFRELRFCLTGERSGAPYQELGERLGLSEAAVKVAVHRLRERYRALLREEIAQTVSDPKEIESELRCLLQALGR